MKVPSRSDRREGAGGAERLVLPVEGQPDLGRDVRVGQIDEDQLPEVVDAQVDVVDPRSHERADDVREHRPVADRHQRLGDHGRVGAQSRAQASDRPHLVFTGAVRCPPAQRLALPALIPKAPRFQSCSRAAPVACTRAQRVPIRRLRNMGPSASEAPTNPATLSGGPDVERRAPFTEVTPPPAISAKTIEDHVSAVLPTATSRRANRQPGASGRAGRGTRPRNTSVQCSWAGPRARACASRSARIAAPAHRAGVDAATPGSTPAARGRHDNGTVPGDGGPPLAADRLRQCVHWASATDIELARVVRPRRRHRQMGMRRLVP
jgi:hypothetical protein